MTIVTNIITDPGENPVKDATVRITLITGTNAPGYTSSGEVQGTYSLSTDATGTWSANLTPNSLITPANTYYQVVEGRAVSNINVPATGGPYLLGSILVVPPTTPGALGITGVQVAVGGTIEGSRPEINLIAGTGTTISAVDNPGAGRVDVTVAAPDSDIAPATTVQAATGYGLAPAVGADTTYAREDHQHGTPPLTSAAPTTSAVTDTPAVGAAAAPARADHVHGREGFGAVVALTAFGTASSSGTATTVPRSDHVHGALAHPAGTVLWHSHMHSGVHPEHRINPGHPALDHRGDTCAPLTHSEPCDACRPHFPAGDR